MARYKDNYYRDEFETVPTPAFSLTERLLLCLIRRFKLRWARIWEPFVTWHEPCSRSFFGLLGIDSMNEWKRYLNVVLGLGVGLLSATATQLETSFNLLDKWVETERTLSKERNDWEVQKQGLSDVIAVYRKELEMLQEKISEAETFTSAADSKRAGLLDEQEALRSVEAQLESIVMAQEQKLRQVIRRLPQPLQREILPLSQRIPLDPSKSTQSVSQRLQNIVGILTQVDKYNTVVEVVPEQRQFADGSLVQVKTIYFGLSAAYFSDMAGNHAGWGRPSKTEGWDWTEDASIAPQVLQLIGAYEGSTTEIEFVPVPVKINL
jgi:hypothetical protein